MDLQFLADELTVLGVTIQIWMLLVAAIFIFWVGAYASRLDARNLERAVHLDYHRVLGDLKGVPYADFPSDQIPMSAFGGKADMPIALQMSAFDPKRTSTPLP